jgi:hypothetical protein
MNMTLFCWILVLVSRQALISSLPSYEAGFYKPTVLKLHPPFCRITAHATVPGYFSTILAFMLLIQINGSR